MVGMCRIDSIKYVGEGCHVAIAELRGIKKPPEQLVEGKKPKPRKSDGEGEEGSPNITGSDRIDTASPMFNLSSNLRISLFLHTVILYCGDAASKLPGAAPGGPMQRGDQ